VKQRFRILPRNCILWDLFWTKRQVLTEGNLEDISILLEANPKKSLQLLPPNKCGFLKSTAYVHTNLLRSFPYKRNAVIHNDLPPV
jgi:hypothetical protein